VSGQPQELDLGRELRPPDWKRGGSYEGEMRRFMSPLLAYGGGETRSP